MEDGIRSTDAHIYLQVSWLTHMWFPPDFSPDPTAQYHQLLMPVMVHIFVEIGYLVHHPSHHSHPIPRCTKVAQNEVKIRSHPHRSSITSVELGHMVRTCCGCFASRSPNSRISFWFVYPFNPIGFFCAGMRNATLRRLWRQRTNPELEWIWELTWASCF